MTACTNDAIPSSHSSPLTVLFAPAHVLIDEAQGGSEYYLPYKLMEYLAIRRGARVVALTVQSRLEHELPGVQFVSVDPDGPLPMSNLERLRFHLRVYATARKILASGRRIDVIHHMYPFGFRATFNLLSILHRHTDPPVVIGPLQSPLSFNAGDEARVSIRDFSEPHTPDQKQRRVLPPLSTLGTLPILSRLSAQTLRRADALVAYTQRTADLYSHFTGSKNIDIIPPGVDTHLFTPARRENNSAYPASERAIQVIAVGYLVQRKAFDVMIAAIAKLVNARVPVHLRIVGDGPALPALKHLARQLGVEQSVTFAGLIPHHAIVHEYHRADVFCSMSLSESFSLVGQEAMACGLPVIATPTGFFRDVLHQEQVGALVRFGDVDQLADALFELATDQSRREMLGHRARSLAVREYDWDVIAQRYLSIYDRVRQGKEVYRSAE